MNRKGVIDMAPEVLVELILGLVFLIFILGFLFMLFIGAL